MARAAVDCRHHPGADESRCLRSRHDDEARIHEQRIPHRDDADSLHVGALHRSDGAARAHRQNVRSVAALLVDCRFEKADAV